jgi:hypothetical protein
VEAMISHVDENNTGEIEIHEFINLLGSIDNSGEQSLDKLIEDIAKGLAFNIDDISSKYESRGHKREFKQHKRMLTLSGRRSLLHENNYISNKPIKNTANLVGSSNNTNSSNNSSLAAHQESSSYFKSKNVGVGRIHPNRNHEHNVSSSSSSSGSSGGGLNDTSENDKEINSIQVDSFNVNSKADYWNHHLSNKTSSKSHFTRLSLKKLKDGDACEELDKIAKYLDQNFDRVNHL